MKSILFVINTMGVGGGEKALLELLRHIDSNEYEVSLFVLTGQGELIKQIPGYVNILNRKYFPISVHDNSGKRRLFKTILSAMLTHGTILKRMKYLTNNLIRMMEKGKIQVDKLLWKILADGAQRYEEEYDLAVAYLEGGSAYYVDKYVKAKRKAAFIHIDYKQAGYDRILDENCYLAFDRIFTVSENVRRSFLSEYPECVGRTEIFYNLLDRENIVRRSREKGGFSDQYDGFRILTVGRLVPQKALDTAIDTMRILKEEGKPIRWYVLGEGELRKRLEGQIIENGLEEDFILLGTVDNPFPYYVQCNLYVHTALYEGKSIAIEEAQVLGCAILVSEYAGVREQVEDGVDGIVCQPTASQMAQRILELMDNPQLIAKYGRAASKRVQNDSRAAINKLTELLEFES